MSITLTREELAALLFANVTPWLRLPNGHIGIVTAMEREDGSGRCFNVRVNVQNLRQTVFVRITD